MGELDWFKAMLMRGTLSLQEDIFIYLYSEKHGGYDGSMLGGWKRDFVSHERDHETHLHIDLK